MQMLCSTLWCISLQSRWWYILYSCSSAMRAVTCIPTLLPPPTLTPLATMPGMCVRVGCWVWYSHRICSWCTLSVLARLCICIWNGLLSSPITLSRCLPVSIIWCYLSACSYFSSCPYRSPTVRILLVCRYSMSWYYRSQSHHTSTCSPILFAILSHCTYPSSQIHTILKGSKPSSRLVTLIYGSILVDPLPMIATAWTFSTPYCLVCLCMHRIARMIGSM